MTTELSDHPPKTPPPPPKEQTHNGAGDPPSPASVGLAVKLVEAALDVETVEKRGRNDTQKYNYAQAEDVIAAATKALLARNVLCDFEVLRATQLETTSKQGSGGLIVTVTGRLTVTDADTGERITRCGMGSGSDYPGDKGIYKAMTGARKYAFLHLLGIPIGDDPDAETRREQIAHAQAPKLDKGRVEALATLIKSHGLTLAQLDGVFGAAGIDAMRARSRKAATERLESLTDEQANALEAELGGSAE